MKGTYDIRIENARIQFKLTLTRSLTVIRGKSATGKTTLVDMVAEYQENGRASGITLSSEKPCVALAGHGWLPALESTADSFVFIDEASGFAHSEEFAHAVRASDNYYVIVSREDLPMLPYSVEEVYELRNTTSRYPGIRKFYAHAQRMYAEIPAMADPQLVIVEDSNAGFEFFEALCNRSGIECVSARGKGNVLAALREHARTNTLVIADGAAFGPHMHDVLNLARRVGAGLFLPESFEWLLLSSNLVRDSDIPAILDNPAAYIESRDFFSWERFFASLLVERTSGTYLRYSKARLNPAYLEDRERTLVERQLIQTGITTEA